VQTQLFRTVSESMAMDGWELTEAELRAGAELAAGRNDHLTVHDEPDQLIDDPRNRDLLAPAGQEAEAASIAGEVIARARTAIEVITAHRQQLQHRENQRARNEELSRRHSSDDTESRHAGTELSGPASAAGAAW
jgi:hypothetical protein